MTNIQLSEKIFKKSMKDLEAAFRVDLKEETIRVYYKRLKDHSDYEFEKSVNKILDGDTFFPPISRFNEIFSSGRPKN